MSDADLRVNFINFATYYKIALESLSNAKELTDERERKLSKGIITDEEVDTTTN